MNVSNYRQSVLSIEVDSNVYSIEAVRNAVYESSMIKNSRIERKEPNSVIIYLDISDRGKEESFMKDFFNSLLDHQIRIDLHKKFGIIREMIVAQAFEPCDNLDEITSQLIDG